jgi:uncharacterized protein
MSPGNRPDDEPKVDPHELSAALERGGSVELHETHISWVLVTGERAYKVKKPLVLPFLDYGTAARRREMCEAEIRLNRRLAPEIYLGVRGIVRGPEGLAIGDADDPETIDYAVEMRRYAEEHTLAAKVERGELGRSEIGKVAGQLARFHAQCEIAQGDDRGARGTERALEVNIEELLGVADLLAERERIRRLARFLTAFIASRWTQLEARKAQGWIREGHGDLRAEHVVLGPSINVVDCVEFDPGLRTLDVADDLAFLVMDLAALGGERLTRELVQAYRLAGGDCGDDALLAFFAVHRALVRAKVMLVRAAQYPAGSAAQGRASARARNLLMVAEGFSWRARLPLVLVFCGAPASGKSFLAGETAQRTQLPWLSSDLIRKRMAGVAPSATASQEHYHEQFSRATYGELGRRAAKEVRSHAGAIVDATFRRRVDRDAFAAAFGDVAPLLFVECTAPLDVMLARARQRERDPASVSDATAAVVAQEHGRWEPLDEVAGDGHVTLRTDRPVERITNDLIALLDQRLSLPASVVGLTGEPAAADAAEPAGEPPANVR